MNPIKNINDRLGHLALDYGHRIIDGRESVSF